MLERFLADCKEIIVGGNNWIAFQANMWSDQGQTNNDFEEKYKLIMINMSKYLAIPTLTRNMRNSDNINKVFQGLKEIDSVKRLTCNTCKPIYIIYIDIYF